MEDDRQDIASPLFMAWRVVINPTRKIELDLTDAARAWLGRVGYDPVYGARPLKRAVQKYLQDPLADEILAGRVHDGSKVKVDEGDGGLVITPV